LERLVSAARVAGLLADPSSASGLALSDWAGVLGAARAERLLATLAWRLDGLALPDGVTRVLQAATADCAVQRTHALWEVEMCRRALAPLDVPVVLLKGSAYVAAGLAAGQGRLVGDLDILVPRDRLDAIEAALLRTGWEWAKPDPYDNVFYRRWMHELPPMIHGERDRMIDVHHTILPLTARPKPDAAALIFDSVPLENGLYVLSPADMVLHAVAHLFADGDLDGGLRNLWDIDRLLDEVDDADFVDGLRDRAALHGLSRPLERALRLRAAIFGGVALDRDRLFHRRLLARDGWGRATRPLLRQAFYLRSHLIRMPLRLLIPHLWTKWRKGLEAR
jgi:hypothetical protein